MDNDEIKIKVKARSEGLSEATLDEYMDEVRADTLANDVDYQANIKIGQEQGRNEMKAKIVEMLENLDKREAVYIDDKPYYPYIRVNWNVIIQKIKELK